MAMRNKQIIDEYLGEGKDGRLVDSNTQRDYDNKI